MCVKFSLSFWPSYLSQNPCALDSSCLQCVVYRRPRAVVALPLFGMLDGRRVVWGVRSCHASSSHYCPSLSASQCLALCRSLDLISHSISTTSTNSSICVTVRSQKSVGLVGGTPTYHPIEAFQPPDSAARTYQYSPDGRLFALAVPSGCVYSRSLIDKRPLTR